MKERRDEKSEAPKLKLKLGLVWGGVGIERSQSSERSDELGENFGEGEARVGLQGLSDYGFLAAGQATVRLLASNFSKGGPLRLTSGRPDECRMEKSSPVWNSHY